MSHEDAGWAAAWQPMVDAVGQVFSMGEPAPDIDPIERSTIRRFLEPLEFDCPLHHDAAVARAYGYEDVVLPCTALTSFALEPMWRPGETQFTSHARDAQPERSTVQGIRTPIEPPTTGYFATEFNVEYLLPAVVGDRLSRRGATLLACQPKETRVGRGAFLTWQSVIVNQRGELVARIEASFFRYNPHPSKGKDAP